MTALKQQGPVQTKLPTDRKPWKKKTPIEIVIAQIDRVRENVAQQEEELKAARRELQKLEEARKVLESK